MSKGFVRPHEAVDYDALTRLYPPAPEYFETAWLDSREEIEAKQLASLTGKAHQKEWNYAMYENRKRRIPRNQVKPPLYESIERAAYEKFMEDEERRLRREALGLFD